jgi:hypothetical protein
MEDLLVALHCLFLLGTDTWVKWQQRSKVQWRPTRFQSQATRDVPEGSESRLGGGYGAEEMGIPYFKARGRYGLELVGEVA